MFENGCFYLQTIIKNDEVKHCFGCLSSLWKSMVGFPKFFGNEYIEEVNDIVNLV